LAVLLRLVRANSYIVIALFIMIALVFSISQYKTKQMYKTHISRTLNTDIKRRDGFQYDQSSLNAIMMARLFYDWDKPYENELDSKTKVILSKAQELNAKWNLLNKNEMNRYSLSDPSWLELIENIEKGTLAYMTENNIENIEKIWLERTEVK
jgi:hypothetical protein